MDLLAMLLPIEVAVLLIAWAFLVKPALSRRELSRTLIRRRVVVNLKMGMDGNQSSYHGTLWDHDGQILILKSATAFFPGAAPQDIPGDTVIERDNVEWVQIVEGV
jgi:hypothetical protein